MLELNRVSFGPITADGLALGSWRLLTKSEVEELRRLAGEARPRKVASEPDVEDVE